MRGCAVALTWAVLLAAPASAQDEAGHRLVCRLETRCDPTGCAVQPMVLQVRSLPVSGDGTAIVDFGYAERQRPVQVLRSGGSVLMVAPNGPDGARFSLRIDDAGDALLSHASALDGGITRTGHCGRPGRTGAGT